MSHAWKEPLCLIESRGSGQLAVNDNTIAQLSRIPSPIAVVGIAGLIRTGKSYLLNLLAGQTKGFQLGSTIQSCTKGIWVWSVDHPGRPGWTLLLMDTEGLGDTEKGDRNHDTWIFALTVLLSSTLVYNSKGTIDNEALEKLYFVTEISEHVKIKSRGEDEEMDFDRCFPSFVWAVRDFTLVCSMGGRQISEDEYLEAALQLKRGVGKKAQSHNLPRECIRSYFRARNCFTFPPPVNDSAMMKNLENLTENQLAPHFIEVAQSFRDFIYCKVEPKMVKGSPVAGSMLAGLAKTYVESIMNGAIPCIEDAVEATANLENTRAVDETVNFYINRMGESVKLPTESAEILSAVHEKCYKESLAAFLKVVIFDSELKYQKRLMERLDEEYTNICHANEHASTQKCRAILDELSQELNQKVASGAYTVSGGYLAYSTDLGVVEQQYRDTPGNGIKGTESLHHFLQGKQTEGSSILAADEKITEDQRREEDERQRAEASERERQAAEETRQRMEQEMADRQHNYEEAIRQLQKKMEEEAKNLREEQEKILESRLEEQQKLLKEGFKERATEMQRDIDKLMQEEKEATERANKTNWWDVITSLLRPAEAAVNVLTGLGALFDKMTGKSKSK